MQQVRGSSKSKARQHPVLDDDLTRVPLSGTSSFSYSYSSAATSYFKQGFTLLELLVVVAIIGMMTAVVAINSNAARSQSRDAKRKTDLAAVAGSLQIYYSEQRQYPVASSGDWNLILKPVLTPTYISLWPTNPTNAAGDGTLGSGFVYYTNVKDTPVAGTPAASLFALDVTLEGKDSVTNNTIDCVNPAAQNFYLSGVQLCPDGKYHNRIASR